MPTSDNQHEQREAAIAHLHDRASILSHYEKIASPDNPDAARAARDFFDRASEHCERLGIDVRAELAGHGYKI